MVKLFKHLSGEVTIGHPFLSELSRFFVDLFVFLVFLLVLLVFLVPLPLRRLEAINRQFR